MKKPILRLSNSVELHALISAAVQGQLMNANSYPFQNCLNCMNWNYEQEICRKWNVKPPVEVLIYSCESYEDDGIIPY